MTRRGRLSWLGLAGIVVAGATVQGLTAVPGYSGTGSALFVAVAAASAIALFAQIALTVAATTAIAGFSVVWRSLLAWTGIVLVAVLLTSILVPPGLPVVVIAAACVLPAAARGLGGMRGFDVFRRAPVAASAAALVTVVAVAITWVVAVASGLFVSGVPGGIALWLWAGAIGALLLLSWTRLQDRPARASGRGARAHDSGEVVR